MSLSRSLQYAFIAIIVTTVGFSLYQWNASRASTQKTAPKNGLVGYWSFDENTGTQAGDASGNGNTGTLTNGPTWVTGKLGKAVSLDGVDDYVDAGNSASMKPSFPFSVSAWVLLPTGGSSGIITTADIAGPYGEYSGYSVFISTGGVTAQVGNAAGWCSGSYRNSYVTNATTLNTNQWYYVTAVFTNASSFSIFVNGASVTTTQSGTNGISIGYVANVPLRMGRYFAACGATTVTYAAQLDEVRIYNRALSGTEVTNLYNLGAEKLNISPTTSLTSGLVGYWTFDGKDTPWSSSSAGTATDRSGNSNTGTLTNMNQSTSVIRGKLGQALNFDGTDDYIVAGNPSWYGTTWTWSAWVYLRQNPATTNGFTIINHGVGYNVNGAYMNVYNSGGTSKIYITEYTYQAVDTVAFPLNSWQLVTATRNGGTISLYRNATLVGTVADGGASVAPTGNMEIGRYTGATQYWPGLIDEVRIYNRALSAGEIQSLYDLGASDKVNSSVSQNQGTGRLDSGLVGYWKLDDASGTTATDSGVRSINGTLTNGPTWGTGQIGGDVVFDGTNDYIATTGNTPFITLQLQPHSFFAWVYPLATSATQSIISYGQSDDNDWSSALGLRGASRTATWLGNGTNENSIAISTLNVPVNQWSFVGVVLNGTAQVTFYVNGQSSTITCTACGNVVTSDPFTIGATYYAANRGGFFSGSIDDARAYNRALSADEVSQLYRLTTPTGVDTSLKGYWSFNGKDTNWTSSSAGTTSDLSGSGNTGTMTNMSQSTSVIRGKLGQALNFDGVDDYVDTNQNSLFNFPATTFSTSLWFKATTGGVTYALLGKQGVTNSGGWAVFLLSTNDIQFATKQDASGTNAYSRNSSSTSLADGNWHHVVVVATTSATTGSNTADIYIDGALNNGSEIKTAGTSATASVNLTIGKRNSGNVFNGKIDEPRVYNRALSSTEVSALYNAGR